jgi:hypothetical protein
MTSPGDRELSLMKNGSLALEVEVVAIREQISCDLERDAVVLHLRDGVYYGLNEVAAKVWNLVQTPRTVLEIRNSLLADYDVEPDDCTRDLLDLLERLRDWKLIELRNGRPLDPS